MTINPTVRSDKNEISTLIELYNRNLASTGFEIGVAKELLGKAFYHGYEKSLGHNQLESKTVEIKKCFDSKYVNSKIDTMVNTISTDTDLAIGMAKELMETTCKSILKTKNIEVDKQWSLLKLLKETTNSLDFTPKEVTEAEKAERAIKQILSGISSIIQGVSELRNSYGSGHGKDSDFKGLETEYAKLLVGVVSEIVILYLKKNGENSELVQ